ncbi:O-methyltransferase [Trujillonella endophytica]|uniref:Predicted O-methyltransferase YrrM n=1 Tax=Trujillonella endophytica TaxID=673521 RepID=A0A1H8SCL9_9ACTN|nr:class I SAM-dependent methyltransferase [Trujillella endophytica]SEO76008.1 Predicted O-methyltransferase YrrM [Trujillella endophytica]
MSARGGPPIGGEGGDPSGGEAGRAYADRFADETPALSAARARAAQLDGPPPVTPAVGATLAVLAAGAGARGVVSVGSGGGVGGLWLLQGMRGDGVLTCLDSDAEQQLAARRAFADAGHPQGRTRMIFGTPGEVLPRLSTGAYDLVVCATSPTDYADELPGLVGLLRPGGVLICHGLLEGGRVADRSVRDPETVAWRDVARRVREDERLTSAVLPVGAGLLVASTAR